MPLVRIKIFTFRLGFVMLPLKHILSIKSCDIEKGGNARRSHPGFPELLKPGKCLPATQRCISCSYCPVPLCIAEMGA